MKKALPVTIVSVLLWTTMALSAPLQGLRGGEVFFNATQQDTILTLSFTPAYGWAEPVSIYSPQGMLLKRFTPSWSGTSHLEVAIPAEGIYRILLNRNYVCDIASNHGQLLYAPLEFETSLQTDRPFSMYFEVPPSTQEVVLRLDNRRGLQGQTVKASIVSPDAQDSPIVLQKKGFTAADILRELNISGSNLQQELSELSPDQLPSAFIPASYTIAEPQSGIWRIDFSSGRIGFWIDGIPNLLASTSDQFFPTETAGSPLPITLARGNQVTSPFLGAVGNFGKNGKYGSFLTSYGVEADKLFLSGAPNTQTIIQQSSPQFSKHTLLVLRSMPNSVRSLPMPYRADKWAKWAAGELHKYVDNANIPADHITIQPFNEPNLEMNLSEYLTYMEYFISTCDNDPKLQNIAIGGPALGSADADTVVNWEWIEALLDRFGDKIQTVIWNCYKVPRPEDTFIFEEALQKTQNLISAHGSNQNIIIGGINRQGGLAPNTLFKGRESGLWWAGTLLHVIQSNAMTGIYYFKTVDTGIRAKGLFTAGGGPKAQAYVQKAVANVLSYPDIFAVQTEHPLVLALAGSNSTEGKLIVVNLSWLPVTINADSIGMPDSSINVLTKEALDPSQLPPKSCALITFTTGSTQ